MDERSVGLDEPPGKIVAAVGACSAMTFRFARTHRRIVRSRRPVVFPLASSRLKIERYAAAIERANAAALGADTAYSGRFHPSASAAIRTKRTRRSLSGPAPRRIPSAHTYTYSRSASERPHHVVYSSITFALVRAIVEAESGADSPRSPRRTTLEVTVGKSFDPELMQRPVDTRKPARIPWKDG